MINEVNVKKVYFYIQEYIKEHGYAPSYREIGSYLGGLSTSTISQYVDELEMMGLIKKERGKKSRTIVLTKKYYKRARVHTDVLEILEKDRSNIKVKMEKANDIDFYVLNGILNYIDNLMDKLE